MDFDPHRTQSLARRVLYGPRESLARRIVREDQPRPATRRVPGLGPPEVFARLFAFLALAVPAFAAVLAAALAAFAVVLAAAFTACAVLSLTFLAALAVLALAIFSDAGRGRRASGACRAR